MAFKDLNTHIEAYSGYIGGEQRQFTPIGFLDCSPPTPLCDSITASSNDEYSYMAFSDWGAQCWGVSEALPQWVKIDIGAGNERICHWYTVQSSTTISLSAWASPRIWILQGSNDDSIWDDLDHVTLEVADWEYNETRTFKCEIADTAYRYFRILWLENNGGYQGVHLAICYIAMFTVSPPHLKTSILAGHFFQNLNVYANAEYGGFSYLKTHIRADIPAIDFNVALRAKANADLRTDIKAGKYGTFYYETEWNPQRFLPTEVEAKAKYEFSFETMTASALTAVTPTVELLKSGYNYPLYTLFLDSIKLDTVAEYSLQLWWARGHTNKNNLKNAKLKVEAITDQYSGGYEIITCNWLSFKEVGGSYADIPDEGLSLGTIPCDSFIDGVLRMECPDCALTRGTAYFKLTLTGDYSEPVYGGSPIFGDGSQYYTGEMDDYLSPAFICRAYVIE